MGGLIGKVSTVTHYAGVIEGETGVTLAERMKQQAENAGVEIIYETVKQVELSNNIKKFIREMQFIGQKK